MCIRDSSYSGSGTSITDLSGNGNNGSLQNTTNISYSSDDGGHFVFNTAADSNYPRIHRTTDIIKDIEESDFTLEFWVNIYFMSVANLQLFINYSDNNPNQNTRIRIDDNKLYVSPFLTATGPDTEGAWTAVDSSSHYDDNAYAGWEHLVFSRIGTENNNFKVYRNNSLVTTLTNKADYDDVNTSLTGSDERLSLIHI